MRNVAWPSHVSLMPLRFIVLEFLTIQVLREQLNAECQMPTALV